MNIFYENGEELNYNLFRYQKNTGVVGIAEQKIQSLKLTTSPITTSQLFSLKKMMFWLKFNMRELMAVILTHIIFYHKLLQS